MINRNVFFALLTALWFFNIGAVDLIKPDEGRYAEISREMNATGEYVTPRINGIKYFEKPPLQYWGSALIFKVAGESNATARLYTAGLGFLCLLATYFFALFYYRESVAQVATGMLAASILFCAQGRINNLDMGLSCFLTLTTFALSVLLKKGLTSREYNWANLIFWCGLGLGFLSKGLIAILLPGLAGVLFILITRDLTVFLRVFWVRGILLFLAIVFPWVYLCAQRNPEFLHFFFVHEHFDRFLTKVHDRAGPPWFFIPIFALGFFPWNLFLWRGRKWSPISIFLAIWCLAVFGFFSVSSSKLPSYILPIWPAMAILVSEGLILNPKKWDLKVLFSVLFGFGSILFVGSFFAPSWASRYVTSDMLKQAGVFLAAAGVVLVTAVVFALYSKRDSVRKILICCLGGLLSYQLIYLGYGQFSLSMSSTATARAIESYSKDKNIPIYSFGYYEQELPFYLKRLITLVNFRGELEFGLQQEKVATSITKEEFFEQWERATSPVMAVFPKEMIEPLEKIKHKVIYEDLRRRIIVKD